jgi:hydrogenase maturation protease
MGNPILSDDGVGLHIARALEGGVPGTEVRTTNMIGLHVLDLVAGFDSVFVIDALQTGRNQPGTVKALKTGEGALHLFSSHGLHFFQILQLGKDLGYRMPEVKGIYGIEIGDECPFGEALSGRIMDKKDEIVQEIMKSIEACIRPT